MQRQSCGGCGSATLDQFLDLGTSPLADAFPTTTTESERRYPLQVAVCRWCWLVQLLEVVDDAELYGADYGFYSSTSPSIVKYDGAFADWAHAKFPEQIRQGVVEIACNDGSLLQHFNRPGIPVLGVEPAAGPAAVAARFGLPVTVEPFTLAVAQRLADQGGRPGLVIAKNVAAHVANLPDFFAGIAHLIVGDGVAVVEVQNLADLLLGNQFDHFYHEHRFYFSAASLARVCFRAGLNLVSTEWTPAQGGSIRAVLRSQKLVRFERSFLAEAWLRDGSAYAGVQRRADHLKTRLLDLLEAEGTSGRTLAGYAASAKSTTLLNWCGIGSDLLDCVVDTTPHKIGRFTPGTHIPIVAPGDRPEPDTYLLLAWNYLGDVLRRERAFRGRWIVPIPMPVIL